MAEKVNSPVNRVVRIPPMDFEGELIVPPGSQAVIIFAHGSGSSRHSPRNRFVASRLHQYGLGTLLLDLLSEEEDMDRSARFDIPLLAQRLAEATAWLREYEPARGLPVGYFGASTGAAAALIGSVQAPGIFAVVSRGGRPDLAGEFLPQVKSPVLLIVGGWDEDVLELNRVARSQMENCVTQLEVVPGATHLFEEPGTLETAAELAAEWFKKWIPALRRKV